MAPNRGVGRAAIAVLNVLFGGLGIFGGGQMLARFGEASVTGIVVGAAGLVAGVSFAVAGIAVWRGWAGARAFGLSASAVTMVVNAAGVSLGIIGLGGLLFGVAYPALLIAWLARPRSGRGGAERTEPETARPGSDRGDRRRVETAIA